MQELGVPLVEREYSKKPLSREEIQEIAGDRSVLELMNPARPGYQEFGFDRRTPTEEEALDALVQDNNILYRPIAIRGDRRVLGLDEDALSQLASA